MTCREGSNRLLPPRPRGAVRSRAAEPRHHGAGSAWAWSAVVACCVLVALSTPSVARGDGVDDVGRGLSDARQALIMGNADEAVRIYREILDAQPDDIRAYWGLVGAYSAAGMERDHLVPLLLARLESHPGDLRTHQELGKAYARLGERALAHEAWQRALRQGRPDGALYSEIGKLELAHNMVEQAVETYLEGRRVFRSPALYSRELVQAYTLLEDYEKAIDECIVAVEDNHGLVQWAVNRVEAMLEAGASRPDIEDRMESIAVGDAPGQASLGFAGSVLLALGRNPGARDAFLRADEAAADEGRALLEYGMIVIEAGRLVEARQILRAVAERHPGTVNAAMASVEAGMVLARAGEIEEALRELKAAGATYAKHAAGGQALLAAARIELDDKRDARAAIETVDELLGAGRRGGAGLVREARLLRSDAYLALGRFEDAHDEAESVLGERTGAPMRERAMFNAAFSSFLMKDNRTALDEFRAMVEGNTSGVLANDALRMMLVIAEGEEELGVEPSSLLASAHAARLRGDPSSAAAYLEKVVLGYGGSVAATEALLFQGALGEDAGEYEKALRVYERVWESAVMVTARAEAAMRSGDILSGRLGRLDDAVESYAAILEDLPENALSGEARRKIDRIRKSTGDGT
jgi:tetratricopeptide (TPR) repeat protein